MRKFCANILCTLVVLSLCGQGAHCLAKPVCLDMDPRFQCLSWRNAGICENATYTQYMSQNCNLTCGHCYFTPQHSCNPERQFPCLDGLPLCVSIMKFCDGTEDCADGHDETDCPDTVVFENVTKPSAVLRPTDKINEVEKSLNSSVKIIHEKDESGTASVPTLPDPGIKCPGNHYLCRKDEVCVRKEFWCDGWIQDCSDGEDERPEHCFKEPNKEFILETYKSRDTLVGEFFTSLQRMKHSHCTERAFSCRGSCTENPPDLDSITCACDPDCFLRRDCCYDVTKVCSHDRPAGILETCVPDLFGVDRAITALVVSRCPDSATKLDTRLCRQKDDPENMRFYGAPVYSRETNQHYRNYYCAQCNGAHNLHPWNVWYDCNKTEQIVANNCTSIFYVPHEIQPKTCKIKHFTLPSFDGSVVTKSERKGLAIERCQETYAPVTYNGTLYRNPYCMFLHRAQLRDTDTTRLHSCDVTLSDKKCPSGAIPCRPHFSCIEKERVCDGVPDCPDSSDEPACSGSCYGKFRCKRTQHECLPVEKVCDGRQDCQDNSDEEDCPNQFSGKYIDSRNREDGINNISIIFPDMNFPSISNVYGIDNYELNERSTVTREKSTKKSPKCTSPLQFDGLQCKYNGTPTADNKEYHKVYPRQEMQTESFNVNLVMYQDFNRPEVFSDNPPIFLARHLGRQPLQIVDYDMGNLTSNGTKDGYISFRRLTQLEKDAGDIFLTKRDKENIIQIGRKVYSTTVTQYKKGETDGQLIQPKTKIDCEVDTSGPYNQIICTGCAYIEYMTGEYTITTRGRVHLTSSEQVLPYYEYELRANGTLLTCWDTPESATDSTTSPIIVWYGVGYSLAILTHALAIAFNLYLGRKTTLRIILINYTTMGLIWSVDSFFCAISAPYSRAGLSLHLFGSLGIMAWLLVMSCHLLLSVTDGNPAVYFSVDNLVCYHVCGWLGPTVWVLPFFFLSKFKVLEDIKSLTDPRQNIRFNQGTEILHFPIWVLVFLTILLLAIVTITARREISNDTATFDATIMRKRLQIKMLVLLLSIISSGPWIFTLILKHSKAESEFCNVVFCLYLVLQGFYLVYVLRCLVCNNLEKFPSPCSDVPIKPCCPLIRPSFGTALVTIPYRDTSSAKTRVADDQPMLPPKLNKKVRTPSYQTPVDRGYTAFPEQQIRTKRGNEDQYHRLCRRETQGSLRSFQLDQRTEVTPVQERRSISPHQYMALIRDDTTNLNPSISHGIRRQDNLSYFQNCEFIKTQPFISFPDNAYDGKGKHHQKKSFECPELSKTKISVHDQPSDIDHQNKSSTSNQAEQFVCWPNSETEKEPFSSQNSNQIPQKFL